MVRFKDLTYFVALLRYCVMVMFLRQCKDRHFCRDAQIFVLTKSVAQTIFFRKISVFMFYSIKIGRKEPIFRLAAMDGTSGFRYLAETKSSASWHIHDYCAQCAL